MPSRQRNLLFILATFVLMWLLHPFYVRNLEAVMEKHGWDQLLNQIIAAFPTSEDAVSSYFEELFSGSGFWAGVFLILVIWGTLELTTMFLRRYRRRGAWKPGLADVRAALEFLPETGEITQTSFNIDDVSDNGTGDFTIRFTNAISVAAFRYITGRGTPVPTMDEVMINAGRVEAVRLKFKKEPDVIRVSFIG